MVYNVERFFKRKAIDPKSIIYFTREAQHTMVCMLDGRRIPTATPLKEFTAHLPTEDFISVSKGVSVRTDQIVHISDDGVYTMTDGRAFQGRKRNLSQHKKNRRVLKLSVSETDAAGAPPMDLLEKCKLMDELPLAFCVIELVFDKEGHGVDFVFRYCNREMETVEGTSLENMLNHSFYEVFPSGDKKWLVAYADVALNGTRRVIRDFSTEIDKALSIHCYQPCPGFCACVLIPD